MRDYILRRLLLIVPTLFGIILINFIIVQWAPGGPVERMMSEMSSHGGGALGRIGGSGGGETIVENSKYRGSEGLEKDLLNEIKTLYGFDKPAHERFFDMLRQYLRFDFGESFFHDKSVIQLMLEKMPVSISLGLWSTLLIYLISIPMGIVKAVKDGSKFDIWSSAGIVIGYAIPGFLFAVLLIVVFAGGKYFDWFPLRGLTSPEWETFPWWQQITDYFWHLALPVTALTIGGFAQLTMLTKNSFIDEIHKLYVVTAQAKGLTESETLYRHVFRNAMLLVIAGFPAAFIGIFLTGSLLIEVIFSLDGLGLLGFEAIVNRDYPVVFGSLFIFTLLGLLIKLITDLTYVWVDPRINFSSGASS